MDRPTHLDPPNGTRGIYTTAAYKLSFAAQSVASVCEQLSLLSTPPGANGPHERTVVMAHSLALLETAAHLICRARRELTNFEQWTFTLKEKENPYERF